MAQRRLNCAQCDAPLPTGNVKSKPRRYCSDACKMAAHRQGKTKTTPNGKAKECQHCGAPFSGDGEHCSDRCYYYAHRDALPQGKEHLRAWDEELVPFVPMGQQAAIDLNRPDWHAWVYGGAVRP